MYTEWEANSLVRWTFVREKRRICMARFVFHNTIDKRQANEIHVKFNGPI